MSFDIKAGAGNNELARPGSIAPGVGKQTLTSQLAPASSMIQYSAPRIDGGGAKPGEGPPLDAAGTVIENMLANYQHISAMVPVPDLHAPPDQAWTRSTRKVRTDAAIPYWNDRYIDDPKQAPAGFDLTTRGDDLATLGVGIKDAVAVAKGTPTEIGRLVARAVELGLVSKPPLGGEGIDWASAWRTTIEAWLLRVGIGLDCSGFVYQTLGAIQQATGAPTSANNPDKAHRPNGILDTKPNVSTSRTNASDEQMGGFDKKEGGGGLPVNPPDELQTGDVMFVPADDGHIRIIMHVDRSEAGITQFTTAESTVEARSTTDPGNGPRIHYWRYKQGVLEHRSEGATEWEPGSTETVYRRHLILPGA